MSLIAEQVTSMSCRENTRHPTAALPSPGTIRSLMRFRVPQAGGLATRGVLADERVLDVVPAKVRLLQADVVLPRQLGFK